MGWKYKKSTMQSSKIAPRNIPATGALSKLYYDSGDEKMVQLAEKGWVLIPAAITTEEVSAFKVRFEAELKEWGFNPGFVANKPMTTKDLPGHFWCIDTAILAMGPAAMELRTEMRAIIACRLKQIPETFASSFDGVMCAGQGSAGKGGAHEPLDPQYRIKFPCEVKDDGATPCGPGHIDQSRFRTATAESHQAFITLTKANKKDVSTILFVPAPGWSIQGVRSILEETFPEFYKHSASLKRKATGEKLGSNGVYEEGAYLPPEHRDFLEANEICVCIKPILNPGDMLIWSSSLPHCGGSVDVPGVSRGPRLGLISGFAPKAMIPDKAKKDRIKWIGEGFATGQQILYPQKHPQAIPPCARFAYDDPRLPPAYKKLRDWRKELKDHPLHTDRHGDDEKTRTYRANIRSLLF